MTQEGNGDNIWNTPLQADGTPAPAVMDKEEQEINTQIFKANDHTDGIAGVRAKVFKVDDDKEALPENVPVTGVPPVEVNADGLY